jgi:hypothetical protein
MRAPFKITLTLVVMGFIAGGILPSRVQAQSANFPAPAQVNADYPDDAQRFAAFNILYDDFSRVARKPLSNSDYAKSFAYQASSNMIATQQMSKDGAGSQAYRDFNARCNQLLSDQAFASSVVEKYQVPALRVRQFAPATSPSPPPVASPASATPVPTNGSSVGMAHTGPSVPHFALAAGASVVGWMNQNGPILFIIVLIIFFSVCSLVMAVAAWLVLRLSGAGRQVLPVPAPIPGGLPVLPKKLQVVSVPGVRYAVYVLSGIVLENKSLTHTKSYTTTTGGGTFQTTGGQIVTGVPQVTHHTSTSVESIVWVRQPNGIDAQWSIVDGNFQCRAGHLISVLVRQGKDGGYILLAYNHSMGRMEWCPALDESHEARGNELGQWAANIAGGYAAWKIMAEFIPSHDETGISAQFAIYWLIATVILVTISFLILTPTVKWFIRKRRNNRFRSKYLAAYRQFFEQGTSVLQHTYR